MSIIPIVYLKRVGEEKAGKLLDECLPISVESAIGIGVVDEVFAHDDYYEALHNFAKSKFDDDFIWDKQDYLEENRDRIEALKEIEIEVMYPEFWEENSSFHQLTKRVCLESMSDQDTYKI